PPPGGRGSEGRWGCGLRRSPPPGGRCSVPARGQPPGPPGRRWPSGRRGSPAGPPTPPAGRPSPPGPGAARGQGPPRGRSGPARQTHAEVLLSVEPQPGEGSVLPRQGDGTQGGVVPSHIDHGLPPAAPGASALPAVLLVPSPGGGPLPGAGAPAVAGAFALCRARFLHPARPAAGAGGGLLPVPGGPGGGAAVEGTDQAVLAVADEILPARLIESLRHQPPQ